MSGEFKIDSEAFYTLDRAAELTGARRSVLLRAISRNELAATKRGSLWYINGAELAKWLSPQCQPT